MPPRCQIFLCDFNVRIMHAYYLVANSINEWYFHKLKPQCWTASQSSNPQWPEAPKKIGNEWIVGANPLYLLAGCPLVSTTCMLLPGLDHWSEKSFCAISQLVFSYICICVEASGDNNEVGGDLNWAVTCSMPYFEGPSWAREPSTEIHSVLLESCPPMRRILLLFSALLWPSLGYIVCTRWLHFPSL